MSLTMGTGPLSAHPAGEFGGGDVRLPRGVLYFEDSPRRVRVVFNGQTVADSSRTKLLFESGHLPVYYFPEEDVRADLLRASEHATHCPIKGQASYRSVEVDGRVAENAVWAYPDPVEGAPPLSGYVAFYWERMDAWYEEDEQVFIHPRDPYHRNDVLRSSRHVRVALDGEVLAETRRPRLLFETGLPTRYYIPEQDVRSELLVASDTTTGCPYKGTASYWSVRVGDRVEKNLVWYYPDPIPEVAGIAAHLCFWNEWVDLEVDGQPLPRPEHSPFSRRP